MIFSIMVVKQSQQNGCQKSKQRNEISKVTHFEAIDARFKEVSNLEKLN